MSNCPGVPSARPTATEEGKRGVGTLSPSRSRKTAGQRVCPGVPFIKGGDLGTQSRLPGAPPFPPTLAPSARTMRARCSRRPSRPERGTYSRPQPDPGLVSSALAARANPQVNPHATASRGVPNPKVGVSR